MNLLSYKYCKKHIKIYIYKKEFIRKIQIKYTLLYFQKNKLYSQILSLNNS